MLIISQLVNTPTTDHVLDDIQVISLKHKADNLDY